MQESIANILSKIRHKRGRIGTHPCRPMNQQLLDQEKELLASGKQPQSVVMEDGGVYQKPEQTEVVKRSRTESHGRRLRKTGNRAPNEMNGL